MAVALEYEYSIYSFQDTPRAASAKADMASHTADGWRVHTAMPNYTELSILWEREAPKARPVSQK